MFAKIANAKITSVRAAVPSRKISKEDELEYYGDSQKKADRAQKMIGIDQRRIAWPGQTASDLCLEAAKALLDDMPQLRNKIDALIFLSQSPDYDLPATACVLQAQLQLPQSCAAFDVNQGCSGYVYGLWLAASLANSGCRHILLLAGDVPYRPRDRANRVTAPIFGDGASATLISRDESAPPLIFSLGTDGTGFEHIIIPAGRARLPFSERTAENEALLRDIAGADGFNWQLCNTCMDGRAVFSFTLKIVPEHILEFFEKAGVDKSKVEYFILHQANRQIIAEIARKAGLDPEKTPSGTFSRYGNLSSASIPAVICDLFGDAGTTGDRLLFLCGYGVGLSWASCLWEAHDCDCAPAIDVPAPPPNPLSKPGYWVEKLQGE